MSSLSVGFAAPANFSPALAGFFLAAWDVGVAFMIALSGDDETAQQAGGKKGARRKGR
jgi:hypothetical protein